jgi:hypothetical protein
VRLALESLDKFSTQGVTSPISFTVDHHKGANTLQLYQVKSWRWAPVSSSLSASP